MEKCGCWIFFLYNPLIFKYKRERKCEKENEINIFMRSGNMRIISDNMI